MYEIINPLLYTTTITGSSVATQVAALLNQNNRLLKFHNQKTIVNDSALYFVKILNNIVVGCTAMDLKNINETWSIHTSVHIAYRNMKIGKELLSYAIKKCKTQYLYTTIRDDNVVSLNLYIKHGFVVIKSDPKHNYKVLTLRRNNEHSGIIKG